MDKNLTMLSNSDVHDPILIDLAHNEHRPLTLVFAEVRTIEAIKEALFARQTAVYWNNFLFGKKEFLEPLFYNSVFIKNPVEVLDQNEEKYIQIRNTSDIDLCLQINGKVDGDYSLAVDQSDGTFQNFLSYTSNQRNDIRLILNP